MKNNNLTLSLLAAFAVLFTATGIVNAQRVYLIVDRDSGTLRTVSSGNINMDGYEVRSDAGMLDPENWNSLTDQGAAGWSEANPRPQQLSELNWEGFAGLPGGLELELGNGYSPAGVLPKDEDLEFFYSTPEGVFGTGNVVYEGTPQVPGITVDRQSGAISVVNALGFDLTGYTISSPSGALSTEGYNSLVDQGVEGWTEANPTANALAELNLSGSQTVNASSPLNVGSAYMPGGAEDLEFEYLTADGEFGTGLVSYSGMVNDFTLQVDLLSGAAQITNPTALAGDFDITGYNVYSPSGSLSDAEWNSLTDSGAEGWGEANPGPTSLAELNVAGSMNFGAGMAHNLGTIFTGSDADLVFEYSTTDGNVATGTVDYVLGGLMAVDPPCNPNTQGDLDGDGQVAFADFLVLSANFGTNVADHTFGDIDCNGSVQFADFLVLSNNFGQAVGAEASSVPEPSSAVLALLGTLVLLSVRKKRS